MNTNTLTSYRDFLQTKPDANDIRWWNYNKRNERIPLATFLQANPDANDICWWNENERNEKITNWLENFMTDLTNDTVEANNGGSVLNDGLCVMAKRMQLSKLWIKITEMKVEYRYYNLKI